MIGYKALHKDFTAYGGFKYEIGKTYELPKDEKLEICKYGFHFCKNPIDVYGYFSENTNNNIIVEVEVLGKIVQEGTKYATDKIKILREYTKEELDKLIVDDKCNTGNYNNGKYNSGDCNTGDCNSGKYNSGDCNSGKYNSGDCNTGDCNSGKYNSGDCNTGDYNSGNHNTGYYNSGHCNTGDYNSGSYNTGIFNTDEPIMRAFNKETDWHFVEFVYSLDYSFQDLCDRIRNNKLLPEDRERIEALPNYDPDIFTEITGIKFDDDKDDIDEEMKKSVISNLEFKVKYLSKEIDALNEIITKLKTKSN